MNNTHSITIGDVTIGPGEEVVVSLPIASYYGQSDIIMPVQVICGHKPGPTLLVNAAIHGDEVCGVEIIRRLLLEPGIEQLEGTLLLVPTVNIYGFLNRSRYLPDRRDLNRCFPGSEKGSLAARVAHLFIQEIAKKATFVIDLHTAAVHRDNLPQVRVSLDQPQCEALAKAFGAPVILDTNTRDGSLRAVMTDMGIPCLVYEGGEALRFDEFAIRAGVKGITSVMKSLEMLPADEETPQEVTPFVARSSYWVRAPESGIIRTHVPLGARVEKDELLGVIGGPFGHSEVPVYAPFSGIVIGRSTLPPTHEGEALFHIARFKTLSSVEASLEQFQSELDPVSDADNNQNEPPIY